MEPEEEIYKTLKRERYAGKTTVIGHATFVNGRLVIPGGD